MAKYGSDATNPNYIESVASLKRKTKEDIRIDSLMPSDILANADRGDKADIKTLLEKYYEFMNMEEFIYTDTKICYGVKLSCTLLRGAVNGELNGIYWSPF